MNSPSLETLSRQPEPPKAIRRAPAWSIPAAILLGFAILFLALFRDRLLPAPEVTVAVVLAAPFASGSPAAPSSSGNPLFQASGWIEPSPLPVIATALVDGVVETVHVLPGQDVKKGDPLATLIPDDARLALAGAEQNHRTLRSSLAVHESAISSAGKKAETLDAQTLAAAALKNEAADRHTRLDRLGSGAIAEADLISAKFRLDHAEAQYLAAVAAAEETRAEVARLEAERHVKQDEIRGAELEVEKAQLSLERTKITSPIDGRILRLLAAPGQKKMLEDQAPESSTIAILYQPENLQVRVDVPLADASGLGIGQQARIRCGLLPDRVFHGEVIHLSGEADLQRNTLQAKVSIVDPADELRPEMLCRVEFLATQTHHSTSSPATGFLATWVPESAVAGGSVWVCDPETKRVSQRAVQTTGDARDGHVRIAEGLRPGEWVVLSPANLGEGRRVHPNLVEP